MVNISPVLDALGTCVGLGETVPCPYATLVRLFSILADRGPGAGPAGMGNASGGW